MAKAPEALQAAADRGELAAAQSKGQAENLQRAIQDLTQRRWIVQQAVEIAKASPTTPAQFRELCEFIRDFIAVATHVD